MEDMSSPVRAAVQTAVDRVDLCAGRGEQVILLVRVGLEVKEVSLSGSAVPAVLGQLVASVEGYPRLSKVTKEMVARRWTLQAKGWEWLRVHVVG